VPPPEGPPGPASPQGFRYLGEDVAYRGRRVDLVTARFAAPDGEEFTRDIVRHPGAVAVVPVTERGGVLFVRQYRGSLRRELLEIPAGTRDVEGEPAEATAGRELEEEVGVRARQLRHLCTIANTPGFCDELTDLFVATGLEPVPHGRHGQEEVAMEVVEVDLARTPAMIASGEIVDAQTIVGLLLARDVLAGTGPGDGAPAPGP